MSATFATTDPPRDLAPLPDLRAHLDSSVSIHGADRFPADASRID